MEVVERREEERRRHLQCVDAAIATVHLLVEQPIYKLVPGHWSQACVCKWRGVTVVRIDASDLRV